jgi:hypothetical protein
LNRNEAVSILKEIFEKCALLDGSYVSLVPPNNTKLLTQGYQVHIKAPVDKMAQMCMQKLLDGHRLAMKMENDMTIIYEPKSKE